MNYIEYVVSVYPGQTEWRKDGKLHRHDGAAVEWADGDKQWYQNGQLHRADGPAIELANGNKFWYQNGKLHRDDGAAIEYANGNKEWHLNGVNLSEEEFLRRTQPRVDSCEGKIVEIEGRKYKLTLVS